MELKDEAMWAKTKEINTDPYSLGVITYVERWSEAMEREIAAGKTVAEVAEATSREADTEGITGFMYGMAVQIMSQCWKWGEDLRRWHNKEYGREDANEKPGAVVNPAIITIRDKDEE